MKRWTKEELSKLDYLINQEHKTIKEIASILNRGKRSIGHTIVHYKIKRNNRSLKKWNKKELTKLEYLVNHTRKTNKEIAILLNRTYGSIERALVYHKIKRRNRYIKKDIQYNITKNGCWECYTHCTSKGYPKIKRNRKSILIIKYLYEQKYNKVPKGMLLCHTCNNSKCINPDHAYIGTYQDNYNDRKRNEKEYGIKLRKKDIIKIRQKLSKGVSNTEIAKEYKVNQSVISRIKTNYVWKHIK